MLLPLISILFVVKFSVLLGAIQGLRTNELNKVASSYDKKLNRRWHYVQASLHILVASFVAFLVNDKFHSPFAFVASLSSIWLIFDITHNLCTKQHIFYSERTGLNGFIVRYVREIGLLLIKLIVLIVSLTYTFKHP